MNRGQSGVVHEMMNDYFRNLPVLDSDRIRLRPIRESDLTDMWGYLSEPSISEFTTWETHTTLETTKAFLESVLKNYQEGQIANWAITLRASGEMVGMGGFMEIVPQHFRGVIGYVLNPGYWNQGIITEAIGLVLNEAFQTLQLRRVEACCITENIGSRRVLEKLGFKNEGRQRSHYVKRGIPRDIELYGLLIQEYQGLGTP